MMCSFMQLATFQFELKLQKCIRMGITIFKIPLGRYIVGYTSPNENFEYSYCIYLSEDLITTSKIQAFDILECLPEPTINRPLFTQ